MFHFPSPDQPIFLEKYNKKFTITCKEASTLVLQAHDLVLLTPVVLNYHQYFIFVAFLDITKFW